MVRVIIADLALGTAPKQPFLARFLSTLGQVEGNWSKGRGIGARAIAPMVLAVAKVSSGIGMVAILTLTPELLEQMTKTIVQAVAPEQIVLFGSQARGAAGPHSGVDLLMVTAAGFGPHRSRIKEITRISKSVGQFGMPTDILLYSQQEVEDWKGSRNHVTTRVLQEGRVIYERCRSSQDIAESYIEGFTRP